MEPLERRSSTIGSLCSGTGSLDLAVERLTGGRTVWRAEVDVYANRVYGAHWQDVHNYGDIAGTDWTKAPPIDILACGFPCQPVSSAGRKRGIEDERWIWPDILNAIRAMEPQPRWLFIENVPGLLVAGRTDTFAGILHSLSEIGYVGCYRTLCASDVGAPHKRERLFVLAALDSNSDRGRRSVRIEERNLRAPTGLAPSCRNNAYGLGLAPTNANGSTGRRLRQEPASEEGNDGASALDSDGPTDGPSSTAHSASPGHRRLEDYAIGEDGRSGPWSGANGFTTIAGEWTNTVIANPGGAGSQGTIPARERIGPNRNAPLFGDYQAAVDRWSAVIGREPPGPLVGRNVNPRFVEWMFGLEDGWASAIVSQSQALRVLGNGVVPLQAEEAFRWLSGQLDIMYANGRRNI